MPRCWLDHEYLLCPRCGLTNHGPCTSLGLSFLIYEMGPVLGGAVAVATPHSVSGNRMKTDWGLGSGLVVGVSLPFWRPGSVQTSAGRGISNSFPHPGTSRSFSRNF